jgi:hypothetical protein
VKVDSEGKERPKEGEKVERESKEARVRLG